MADQFHWRRESSVLRLKGTLQHETLEPLWLQRASAVEGIDTIDLSEVDRVDTAGLVLLVQLVALARNQGGNVQVSGASDNLHTLAGLYNLSTAIFPLVM